MPRTTLDIDATVLKELKRRRQREGKTLGQLASEMLAKELAKDSQAQQTEPLQWEARSMGARIDLEDKDALYAILDGR